MTRKEFFREIGSVAIGVSASSLLLAQGCSASRYMVAKPKLNSTNSTIDIEKNEVDVRGTVLLARNSMTEAPLCITRKSDGTYAAILMKCTHKGCELRLDSAIMVCPCHGSEFNNSGKVLLGPAQIDLTSYRISEHDNTLSIHLN